MSPVDGPSRLLIVIAYKCLLTIHVCFRMRKGQIGPIKVREANQSVDVPSGIFFYEKLTIQLVFIYDRILKVNLQQTIEEV